MSEFEKMFRSNSDPPTFGGGSTVPVATYLLTIVVLSGLVLVSPSASPPPLLGTAWGVFLVALALGASKIEAVDPRSIFPSVRTLAPVVVTLGAFWAAYNLVAVGLAAGGVSGFEAAPSSVAAQAAMPTSNTRIPGIMIVVARSMPSATPRATMPTVTATKTAWAATVIGPDATAPK